MDSVELGRRIRDTRRHYGLMQKQLADALGVDRATWSQWENNRREELKLFACGMNLPVRQVDGCARPPYHVRLILRQMRPIRGFGWT